MLFPSYITSRSRHCCSRTSSLKALSRLSSHSSGPHALRLCLLVTVAIEEVGRRVISVTDAPTALCNSVRLWQAQITCQYEGRVSLVWSCPGKPQLLLPPHTYMVLKYNDVQVLSDVCSEDGGVCLSTVRLSHFSSCE